MINTGALALNGSSGPLSFLPEMNKPTPVVVNVKKYTPEQLDERKQRRLEKAEAKKVVKSIAAGGGMRLVFDELPTDALDEDESKLYKNIADKLAKQQERVQELMPSRARKAIRKKYDKKYGLAAFGITHFAQLNERLALCTEEEAFMLLVAELTGMARPAMAIRIHKRINYLRMHRERAEILERCKF